MDIQTRKSLTRNLSPIGAGAFALGTSIGWGSLVVTANTYLAQAGPVGSVIGLVLGAIIMLVVCQNNAYMMSCYPDAGGVYSFCRECFGYDHGFLAAWFLVLTYLAMLWANATSLPLFARYFLGGHIPLRKNVRTFRLWCVSGRGASVRRFHSRSSVSLCAVEKCRGKADDRHGPSVRGGYRAVLLRRGDSPYRQLVTGLRDGQSPLGKIVKIAVISPWAFIGFESISHSTEEFSFPQSRFFRVLAVSVAAATLLYVFVTLLSVTAYPPSMAVGWNIYVIWTI